MTASPILRDLTPDDYQAWRPLWQAYCDFYRASVPAPVTATTWARLHDPAVALYGRVAEVKGQLVGFAHIVIHPGTWSIGLSCYLEDLFVSPDVRGQGIGHALINRLIDEGKAAGWAHLYWVTERDNATARRLYDRLLPADDFVRYRLRLDTPA